MSQAQNLKAVQPKVSRSQVGSGRKDQITALVHQAAVVCVTYKELAQFVRLAVAKQYNEPDWCVAVTRSLYSQSRVRHQSAAILSVPCLIADLPTDGRPLKEHAFTVLLWRCAGDAERAVGASKLCASPVEGDDAREGNSSSAHTDGSATIADSSLPQLAPQGYRCLSTTITYESDRKLVSRLAGAVQRREGLHAGSCEGTFASALRAALTQQYGSTWHVLLGCATQDSSRALAEAESGTRLLDAGRLRKEKERSTRSGGAAEAGSGGPTLEDRLGAAQVYPSAHAPAFAVTAAPGCYHEFTLDPYWPSGREGASADEKERTPPLYHVLAFRTEPGQGEPTVEEAAGSFLPGWDGSLTGTRGLVKLWLAEPYTALRVVCYAAAAACFLSFALLAYRYDNSCSRIKGIGLGSSAVLTPVAVPVEAKSDSASQGLRLRSAAALWHDVYDFLAFTVGVGMGIGVGEEADKRWSVDSRLAPLPDLPESDPFSGANPLAQDLGLPAHCGKWDVLQADTRMMRSRALMYAALAFGTIAILLRRVQVARDAAHWKGSMKGLMELAPRKDAVAKGGKAGGGAGGRVKAG